MMMVLVVVVVLHEGKMRIDEWEDEENDKGG
jgi:hypothetical protein